MIKQSTFKLSRLYIGLFTLSGFLLGCSGSDNEPVVVEEPTPVVVEKTPEEVLEEHIQAQLEPGNIPGIAAGVIKNGRLAWSKGFGYSNLATQVPVTADTPFTIASTGKAVIGVALMKAVEDYNISLDDDINSYGLPYLIDNPNINGEVITLRHLATHTSGIIDNDSTYPCGFVIEGTDLNLFEAVGLDLNCPRPLITDLPEFMEAYFEPTGIYYDANLNFDNSGAMPGENFNYSNVASSLAARVIGHVSGSGFDVFTENNIFSPLEMTNTHWHYDDYPADTEIATQYYVDSDGDGDGEVNEIPRYLIATYPDSSLKSTVNDLAKFLLTMMHQGEYNGNFLLSSESINEIMSDAAQVAENRHYGLFWDHLGQLWGHDGSDPGNHSLMYFHPEQQTGFIVLLNIEIDAFPDGRVDSALAEITNGILQYLEN
ncbi:MAG: serine hydrolase domain-containing protein [Aestuariibacter sp.]